MTSVERIVWTGDGFLAPVNELLRMPFIARMEFRSEWLIAGVLIADVLVAEDAKVVRRELGVFIGNLTLGVATGILEADANVVNGTLAGVENLPVLATGVARPFVPELAGLLFGLTARGGPAFDTSFFFKPLLPPPVFSSNKIPVRTK